MTVVIASGIASVATTSAIVIQAIAASTAGPLRSVSSITGSAIAAEDDPITTA